MAQHPNYFPLDPGNQWVYVASGGAGGAAAQVVEVARAVESGGRWYWQYQGFEGSLLLRTDESGNLYWLDPQTRSESRIGSFLDDGAVFEPRPNPCRQTGRIAARNARYKGPLGEFDSALVIRYMPGMCSDAGLESEVYLPYIGLVQRTVTTIAGPRVYELVYARLGGVTVVSAPEAGFGLALNGTRLTPKDTLIARISLRNTLPAPVRLTFPSGQLFDLAIKNEKGERVYLWSSDKAFPMVIVNLEVSGEKNFVVDVPLSLLKPGRYTVEAWLTTMGVREWSASAPLEIQ
jgi:hypothetical protein